MNERSARLTVTRKQPVPYLDFAGNGTTIMTARQNVLDQAYEDHPERFPNGRPQPPKQPSRVWINPTRVQAE